MCYLVVGDQEQKDDLVSIFCARVKEFHRDDIAVQAEKAFLEKRADCQQALEYQNTDCCSYLRYRIQLIFRYLGLHDGGRLQHEYTKIVTRGANSNCSRPMMKLDY